MKTKRKRKFNENFKKRIDKAVEEENLYMLYELLCYTYDCKLAKKFICKILWEICEVSKKIEEDKNYDNNI